MASSEIKKKAKEFAGNLFTKLLDKKDDEAQSPPPNPPGPSAGTQNAAHGLIDSFNNLSVQPQPASGFVGGFHPGYAMPGNASLPSLQHASSAPPPMMPSPAVPGAPQKQSVTMQMALRPDASPTPARPSSAPSVPFTQSQLIEVRPVYTPPKPKPKPSRPQRPETPESDDSFTPSIEIITPPKKPAKSKPTTPNAKPPKVKPSSSAPGTPSKTPKRPSATSVSSNGSGSSTPGGREPKEGQVQCSGTTKAGKRCTRMVKVAPALSQQINEEDDDSDGSESNELERFCFQHTKELLTSSGCYARKNGEWVEFKDWIPAYLQYDTQVLLRIEMEKARSTSDQDGYIYTFEIREDDDEVVKLKVGRAVNLAKRIDEWSKQCGSKQQVLRGFYPNPEEDVDAPTTLMKGRVKAGEKSACCHRLERLIHLELADLAATQVYLQRAWPNIVLDDSSATSPARASPEKRTPCPDCGSRHKEIFEFHRWTKGPNKNKEWEKIVKPIIERWGKFIELYV
ncbi:hypothetical protein BKA70DRAFT_1416678 [Coprinopsis sp. MPI-PUGE-AT-0042]|nr:hypothetical protein BKA70DRAFT_1416678 [Coprinopsis sp. MPI-PUGE-AT-0042]